MTARQNILIFLFALSLAQGFFLAPVIANLKGAQRRSTAILALLILCFLPMIGEELLEVSGRMARFPHALGSSITVDFLIAPLLLFYGRSLTDADPIFDRRDLRHLLPFALAVLVLLPFYALSGAQKLQVLEIGLPASFKLVIAAKILIGAAYLSALIRHLRRVVNTTDHVRARDPNVVWLLRSMYALATMTIVSLVIAVLPPGVPVPIDSDALGTLFIGGSLYLISFLLIRHPLTAAGAQVRRLAQVIIPEPLRPRYETSPLTALQKQQYQQQLIRHMEREKPYLDMQLSLEKLAGALNLRPGYLSQVLNERLEVNFYEFINEYRVREAQWRLADPAQADKTILAIAYESGFNSKASFNRAFKRVTGQTPSEYARSRIAGNGTSEKTSQSIE